MEQSEGGTALQEENLIEDKKAQPPVMKGSSIGTAFALVFCMGFGAALLYAGHSNSAKVCDRPLFDFLVGFGLSAVFAALVFLGLELVADGSGDLKGIGFFAFWVCMILFFAFGITGSVYYWDSDDCDTLAAVAHRWTFAGVLAFLILAWLIISALLGKFGAPFFAVFAMLLANLFDWLANLFKGLADVLNDDGDPENQAPKRNPAANFALHINHTVVMWFFGYILWQVADEWDDPCDTGLHSNLLTFGTWGLVMAYCDFLFEKFAGMKTRVKLKTHIRVLWVVNIVAYIIWGIETCTEVIPATSCKETAKDVYRMSFLLSCIFFVFCGLLLLGLCAGLLDFLCSGRLRFVVVVESGPADDEEKDI